MTEDSAPTTVTEAVDLLRAEGYVADFELVDGELVSHGGGPACAIDRASVDRLFRFEGPSDPGDEMIVFALHDPDTGAKGTLATAFGPAADPDLVPHLADLRRRFG